VLAWNTINDYYDIISIVQAEELVLRKKAEKITPHTFFYETAQYD